jgi:hypothetical protein
MWTVNFNDYLEFNGVKTGIKEVKAIKKTQQEEMSYEIGLAVEKAITKILGDFKRFTVKALSPQMDLGFGADVQVSYKEGNKNYSFFVDITSTQKQIRYFTLRGTTTDNVKEAFKYETDYFNIYFGVKERHANHFFYEKPVIVLYIEHFIPCTGLSISHINNISSLLISFHSLLVEMGFGARASKMIRPNINRHRADYAKLVALEEDTPQAWGSYFYQVFNNLI